MAFSIFSFGGVTMPNNLSGLVNYKRVWYAADTVVFQRGTLQADGVFDGSALQEFVYHGSSIASL